MQTLYLPSQLSYFKPLCFCVLKIASDCSAGCAGGGEVQRPWCRLSLVPASTHSWGRTRLPPYCVSIANYDSAFEPVHVRAAWY